MGHVLFVILIVLIMGPGAFAAPPFYENVVLGEKNSELFWRGQFPEMKFNSNNGKIIFVDDEVDAERFYLLGFKQGPDILSFLQNDLDAGLTCPNELLGKNFDYIRYGHRLMSLSLLIEDYWHLQALSGQFKWKNSCERPLLKIIEKCRPKSQDMKTVVNLWRRHLSKNPEKFHPDYNYATWKSERATKKSLSHYRVDDLCKRDPKFCSSDEVSFESMCSDDISQIENICSESDQIYGVSTVPQIFYSLSRSNFINTFNKEGQGIGCMRRVSQMMLSHEVKIPSLKIIGLVLPNHLTNLYGNRFPQGRPFVYGSLKEFADKGLTEIFEETSPIVEEVVVVKKQEVAPKIEAKKEVKVVEAPVKKAVKKEIVEISAPMKSAFLQAAEVREAQNLDRVEVDMVKLKYDYVFSLNMIQKLNATLKTYMGRDALVEMSTYDKLGTKEGPVPLLFIKFMLDMQEHQGLYNLMAVLGERFYVSNEIDSQFNPKAEMIELKNDDSTNRQWQINIVRP